MRLITIVRRYEGGIMLEIAYGRTITGNDEFFIEMASNATVQLTEAGSPSASLVDFIPIRRSLKLTLPTRADAACSPKPLT